MHSLRNLPVALKHLVSTLFVVTLTLTLSANITHADVTLFTDRNSFNAATTGLNNIDFEGLIPSPSGFKYYPNGLTQKNVAFHSIGCDLYVTGQQYPDGYYQWGSGAVLTYQHSSTNILEVDLPDGVTAVGSDVMTILATGDPVTVVLSTGETYNVPTSPEPNRAFMGLVSSQPIKSMIFSSMSYGVIDNFVFGKAAIVSSKVTTFTNRAAFISQLQNQSTINFEGIATSGSFREYGTSAGLWLNGVNFVGVPNNIVRGYPYGEAVVDPAFYRPYYDWGSGAVLNGSYSNGQGGTIYVTLPDGVNAVGGDLMTFAPYGAMLHVTLSTGESVDVPTNNYPGRAFVGFTSSIPIKTIAFKSPYGTEINLDNLVIGTTAVSEVMLGTPKFIRTPQGSYYLSVKAYLKGNGTVAESGHWTLGGETLSVSPGKTVALSLNSWTEGAELQMPWNSISRSTFDLAFHLDTPVVLFTDTVHAVVTGFRPDVNGWGFNNQTRWSIIDEMSGLCLGMVSTARSYYVTGKALPTRNATRTTLSNITLAHSGGNSWLKHHDIVRSNSEFPDNFSLGGAISDILNAETSGLGSSSGINGQLAGYTPCIIGILHLGAGPDNSRHALLATSNFQCARLFDAATGRETQCVQVYALYDPNLHDQFRHAFTSILDGSQSQSVVTYIPDGAASGPFSDFNNVWIQFTGWWEPPK